MNFTEQTLALLSRGSIDINEGDPAGWTPLMYGASRGFSRIVETLLNVGADTSVRMESGCTALRLAVVTLLVQAGADLDAINCQGLTPLHLAAGLGNSEIVQALIEAGSSPNKCLPSDGESPLFTASSKGHTDVVRVLLSAKANARLARARTPGIKVFPLESAVCFGHVEIVRELLQHRGVEGCGGANAGIDALYHSVCRCSPRSARLLVDAGTDTRSTFRIMSNPGDKEDDGTMLAHANRALRKKIDARRSS